METLAKASDGLTAGLSRCSPTQSRWAVLGALRFLLASIVVVTHATFILPTSQCWGASLVTSLGSFNAVLGFFLISGYSIAASIDREPDQFYARRFWRIAPIYLFGFILAQVPWILSGAAFVTPAGHLYEAPGGRFGELGFLLNALCLQGFLSAPVVTFQQSWSLSCEVIYYAFAPRFAKLTDRLLFVLMALSGILYVTHSRVTQVDFASDIHGWAVAGLAWAWLLGFWWYRHRDSVQLWPLLLLPVLMCSAAPQQDVLFGAAILVLVALALHPSLRLDLSHAAESRLKLLGDISYPLYLTHLAVICCLGILWRQWTPCGVWIMLAASVGAATGAFYLVDVPARRYVRWRNRRAASLS